MTTFDNTLDNIVLDEGSHTSPSRGVCIMECVAYLAGEPHTDHPECACEVVTEFAMNCNDVLSPEDRPRLTAYALRIAGSRANDGQVPLQRARFLLSYATRVCLPLFLAKRQIDFKVTVPELETHADIPSYVAELKRLQKITRETEGEAGASMDCSQTPIGTLTNALLRALRHLANNDVVKTTREVAYGLSIYGISTTAGMKEHRFAMLDRLLEIGHTTPLPTSGKIQRRISELVRMTAA